jgi:opacity protein-like surface antigen
MNTNKFLIAGLMASVMTGASSASECNNGGFYGIVQMGVSIQRAKYTNNIDATQILDLKSGKNSGVCVEQEKDGVDAGQTTKAYIRNELRAVPNANIRKRNGAFDGSLGFGYKTRINDVMLGIDLTFGKSFKKLKKTEKDVPTSNKYWISGGNTKATQGGYAYNNTEAVDENTQMTIINESGGRQKYDAESKKTMQLKNRFYVQIMPTIGYLVTPNCELYLTAGAKITSDKATLKDETSSESIHKTKTRIKPQIGAGIVYTITPNIFTRLSYVYGFKTKISKKASDDAIHKFERSEHKINLGLGYMF